MQYTANYKRPFGRGNNPSNSERIKKHQGIFKMRSINNCIFSCLEEYLIVRILIHITYYIFEPRPCLIFFFQTC